MSHKKRKKKTFCIQLYVAKALMCHGTTQICHVRRSAGILRSHYEYLTRKLEHWNDLNFKIYMRKNRVHCLALRWEVHHFTHLYHSYNRSQSPGGHL